MTEASFNPYQPVAVEPAGAAVDPGELSFRVTLALNAHAESQYLLRWHSRRLLVGSLLMIALSFGLIAYSAIYLGGIIFLVTVIGVMSISATIYLALVHRAKANLRERQRIHGLNNGAVYTVELDEDQLQLTSPMGVFRWPVGNVRVYRTTKGRLLCPEPLAYIFVPNTSESSQQALDRLYVQIDSLR